VDPSPRPLCPLVDTWGDSWCGAPFLQVFAVGAACRNDLDPDL